MAIQNRKTIGQNPLDSVVPDLRSIQSPVAPPPQAVAEEVVDQTPTPDPSRKERLTIHLSSGLIDRLKNAVYWTPGLTLATLSETALTRMVEELEGERGGPFQAREGELKGGRPLK